MNSRQSRILLSGALGVLLLATLTGCSSISVNYDYDQNAAFGSYRTYAWLGSPDTGNANPAVNKLSSDLLDKRIHEAVDAEMGNRNITAADNPDVLVKYFLGTEDKVQVTDWGYRYSDYYWGHGGRQIDVTQYTEGTLVVDIIDAATKTLVWRGTATGTVDGQQRTPEQLQERINEVVAKIFANFPPK